MAYTFGVVDVFGLANTSFKCLTGSENETQKSAVAKGGDGDYVPASVGTYDEQTECVCEYEASVTGAVTFPTLKLGDVAGGYTLTSVAVTSAIGQHLKMRVSGHKHATAHNVKKYTLALPAFTGFNATDVLTAGSDGCQGSSWGATVEHTDKLKRDGTFLCGVSHGCKIEATGEYVTDAALAYAEGWTEDATDKKTGGDFYTASLKAHKYQAADA